MRECLSVISLSRSLSLHASQVVMAQGTMVRRHLSTMTSLQSQLWHILLQ